jgi:hypothetical protein
MGAHPETLNRRPDDAARSSLKPAVDNCTLSFSLDARARAEGLLTNKKH